MRLETEFVRTSDGIDLFVRSYTPDQIESERTLFWIHGLGEHGGRHEHLFRVLADRGWRTVIPDLRGHGKSTGVPTHVNSFNEYLTDVELVWREFALSTKTTALLGHSMGGLIAVRAVQTQQLSPAALVVSSPLLGVRVPINPLVILLGRLVVPFIATTRFSNGIDPSNMTHDAEFAALRRGDPFINKTVTAGWFFAMKKALAAANRETDRVTIPTLALQGSLDETTDPDALAKWFRKIASTDKDHLLLKDHFHELFFEPDWKTTLDWTIDWLDDKVPDLQTLREGENVNEASRPTGFTEDVELAGHIIDSLLLPKVLDEITGLGGDYHSQEIRIGHDRRDPSYVRLSVSAPTEETLERILTSIGHHGAVPVQHHDVRIEAADLAGSFPEGFYATTNEPTEIRLGGKWIRVERQEMDCGIAIDRTNNHAHCVAMADVKPGDQIVMGRIGVRVFPVGRDRDRRRSFGFMNSTVSSEKPKNLTVREIAESMRRAAEGNGRILIVAGPAVVHTGSRELLSWLIRHGYVHVLFAGNALATHDIEQSFYGTSLGISMESGGGTDEGHEHHLRSINRIRRVGGIPQAIEQKLLTTGIMYECVKHNVPYVLAGSIRDDGPLPDVITDSLEAQSQMRELVQGVTFCLMIATTLHSIAVGNLLPAWVQTVCVDINPATVTKLSDRGTFQTIGLVTDVEPFLRILVQELSGSRT